MACEIIWEPQGVWRRFHGTVGAGDIIQSVEQVHNDWRFDSLRYSINDFLAIELVDVNSFTVEMAAIQALGARMSNPHLVLAMVATDPRVIELASVFADPMYRSFPVQFFATVEEARAWLGSLAVPA